MIILDYYWDYYFGDYYVNMANKIFESQEKAKQYTRGGDAQGYILYIALVTQIAILLDTREHTTAIQKYSPKSSLHGVMNFLYEPRTCI